MSETELRVVERLEEIPEPVPDAEFVVVDVIISSTAVVRLLEEGAEYVRTFGDAQDALAFKRENDAVLVGEQAGAPIDGFDLSPLPSVFSEHDLEGRPVGIMTTNGTRAVEKIGKKDGVFFGSTVNAGAVADALREHGRDAWIVAAGRYGETTPEDTAGAELIREMYENGGASEERAEEFRSSIRESGTASWIDDLGYWHEIEALLEFNESETVPRMRDGVFVDES
ncbi:MAG: 2-phosphosulfolactate phosphatase [Halobacteriales archaeon]|nr:2-phosphosulfolactate phosphatase [Halobacteriales archaeon]